MLEQDLEKVSYLVVVKILEARGLKGDSSGGVHPYVKISCGNLSVQQTRKMDSAIALWNQSFTFPDLKMNKYEMETFELILEVFDEQRWSSNTFVGSYSIGLSTMHRFPNSEIHNRWLRLSKPDNPTQGVGFLQVSCFIVGPGQDPPVHDSDEIQVEEGDEQQVEMLRQGMDPQIILEAQKTRQGLAIVDDPRLNFISYSLMVNVYKGENLPMLTDGITNVSPFVSVRSQGCTLATRIVREQLSPNWGQRLYIPVFVPTWNDKVKVALWHRGNYFGAVDEFLANIREHPSANDEMNISTLHSKEGKMEPTWFNLYGIRPKEQKSGVQRMHSSAFMGRILMSLHLQQNEKPQLTTQNAQAPSTRNDCQYKLWIEVYDLVNCDELLLQQNEASKQFVTIQAYQNGNVTAKKKASRNLSTQSFTFTQPDFTDLVSSLPEDPSQIPDLFINVNVTQFEEETKKKKTDQEEKVISNERVGFIRLSHKEIMNPRDSKPKWHVVQSLVSRKKTVGRLLANARLVRVSSKDEVQRKQAPRGREVQYYFFAQIFSGYELAPAIPEEDLKTRVEIKIGIISQQKTTNGKKISEAEKEIKTRVMPGRFPRWNWSKKPKTVTMPESAEFASDMRVLLYSIEESMYKGKNQVLVGQFLVPISSMLNSLYKRPQYYNIVDSEGAIQGKVLARFLLLKRDNNPKQETQIRDVYKLMKEVIEKRPHIVDLKISILGIRNLVRSTKDAEMEICLTNHENIHGITVQQAYRKAITKGGRGNGDEGQDSQDDEENRLGQKGNKWQMEGVEYKRDGSIRIQQMHTDADGSKKLTRNPNFGKVLCFEKILLQEDMLLWPHLIIKVYESGFSYGYSSSLILPIFIFADSFMTERDIKMSLAMFTNNNADDNQKQMDPLLTYYIQLARQGYGQVKLPKPIFDLRLLNSDVDDNKNPRFIEEKIKISKIKADFGFTETMDLLNKETGELTKDEEQKENRVIIKKQSKVLQDDRHEDEKGGGQHSEESSEAVETEEDLKEIWKNFKEGKDLALAKKTQKKVKNKNEEADEGNLLLEKHGSNISPFQEDPVHEMFQIDLTCTEADKEKEKKRKEEKKQELSRLLEKVRKINDSLGKKGDPDFKEMIRFQMMFCRNQLEDLDRDVVKESDFEIHNLADDDEDQKFNYGNRQKHRGTLEQELEKILPFMSLPLVVQEKAGMLQSVQNVSIINGIFTSGKPDNSFLRFAVGVEKNNKNQDKKKKLKRGKDIEGQQDTGFTEESAENSYDNELSDDDENTLHQRLTVGGHGMLGEEDDGVESLHKLEDAKTKVDSLLAKLDEQNTSPEDKIEQIRTDFAIDIFRAKTLQELVRENNFYLRVYVLTCQNLAAMNSNVRYYMNQLAGDQAMSSADPFLMMRIVREEERLFYDGTDKHDNEVLKTDFFEAQELYPVSLQEDWHLDVEVWDYQNFPSSHSLIGKTKIDIEERRWSMTYVLAKLILQQEKDKCDDKIKQLKEAKQVNKKLNIKDKERVIQATKLNLGKCVENYKKLEQPLQKVEYRSLYHPDKEQAQGTLEMWVEVLDADEAKQTTLMKIDRTKTDEKYEVRLIIWETRDVPIPNGSSMNAQIRAIYEREGLSVEPMIKETDLHRGCKTGRAMFNWRMIFRIGKDDFPRLKLQIFDSGVGGNEAIGELTLNLKTSIKLLQKVGVLEDKKIWVAFANPNKGGAPAGFCLIQLQILYEMDADAEPVGERRDEPNKNPVLREPPEGRGFGAMLAGLGLSMPSLEMPWMGLLKKVLIALFVMMILFFIMFLILSVK